MTGNIDIRIELLSKWTERDPFDTWQPAWFKANIFKTRELLEHELNAVGARNIVLYTMHEPAHIGRGGWPRGDRAPRDSGVILEFEKPIAGAEAQWEELRFPCRAFQKWEDNLRAIALALEALRKIDRYGVTTGAQYAGYKALPPANVQTEISPELAADFIAKAAGMGDVPAIVTSILNNAAFAQSVYRAAAQALHPDRGGNAEEFSKLDDAWRLVQEKQQAGATGG